MPSDPVGPIITPEDVLQAVLRTLQAWLPYYLSNLLSKRDGPGVPQIPDPKSYHGGIDEGSWIGEVLPEVMVLTPVPIGEPERPEYLQWYSLNVKVACKGDQTVARAEDEARVQASYLGAALMLLVQQTSLGGLTQDLVMAGAPTITFPNPDERFIVQATVRFNILVGSIITQGGPKGTVPEPEGPTGEQGLGPPAAEVYIAEKASFTIVEKDE